jgi:hypothetical protein
MSSPPLRHCSLPCAVVRLAGIGAGAGGAASNTAAPRRLGVNGTAAPLARDVAPRWRWHVSYNEQSADALRVSSTLRATDEGPRNVSSAQAAPAQQNDVPSRARHNRPGGIDGRVNDQEPHAVQPEQRYARVTGVGGACHSVSLSQRRQAIATRRARQVHRASSRGRRRAKRHTVMDRTVRWQPVADTSRCNASPAAAALQVAAAPAADCRRSGAEGAVEFSPATR